MTACNTTVVPAARALLAGTDTIHLSLDIEISDELRAKLDTEKVVAQEADKVNGVHCPDWLGAQVLPHGARGGYGLLLETENFSVKILGSGIPNRPGLFIELRSHFLHTHPEGPAGASEEVLAWIRKHLLADRDPVYVETCASFKAARLSRLDLHIDWQGGWTPSALDGDASSVHRFIKPARVKWQAFTDGTTFTGFVFGSGSVLARIYNKSHQATQKLDDAYFALLAERNPETFDPEQDVWRLEFQLRREGIKGFKLYSEPDVGDVDAVISAELSAEDLEHIGSLSRFFTHQTALWQHLTQYWLQLVVPDEQANQSRWPMDPTWSLLHEQYGPLAHAESLGEKSQVIVRGARYTGKSRLLRRMLLGVVDSLEVEDASPASASLAALQHWMERVTANDSIRLLASFLPRKGTKMTSAFPPVKVTTRHSEQKHRGRPPKVGSSLEPGDEHLLLEEPKVLLVTPKVAGKVLAISENAVYRLIATKQLLSVKFGNCRRIPYSALEVFVTQLLEESA